MNLNKLQELVKQTVQDAEARKVFEFTSQIGDQGTRITLSEARRVFDDRHGGLDCFIQHLHSNTSISIELPLEAEQELLHALFERAKLRSIQKMFQEKEKPAE
jgi:hypothetical protein